MADACQCASLPATGRPSPTPPSPPPPPPPLVRGRGGGGAVRGIGDAEVAGHVERGAAAGVEVVVDDGAVAAHRAHPPVAHPLTTAAARVQVHGRVPVEHGGGARLTVGVQCGGERRRVVRGDGLSDVRVGREGGRAVAVVRGQLVQVHRQVRSAAMGGGGGGGGRRGGGGREAIPLRIGVALRHSRRGAQAREVERLTQGGSTPCAGRGERDRRKRTRWVLSVSARRTRTGACTASPNKR